MEQLVLFGSGEMFLSWVKSEGRICISTEPREEFFRKLNTSKHAITSNHLRQKIDVRPVEFCNLSVFLTGNSHVVLAFNVVSSHLFAWRVGFVLEAFLTLRNHRSWIARHARSVTSKSVHVGALYSR